MIENFGILYIIIKYDFFNLWDMIINLLLRFLHIIFNNQMFYIFLL